jgi:hypothetical protein
MTEDDIIRIGFSADQVLASEAFQLAMQELEKTQIENWANGVFKTPHEREEAYGLVRGARTFKSRLEAMLASMKLSKAQAERRTDLSRN